MENKNICMTCGKKSKNDLKYRVYKAQVKITFDYRDFCSTKCLIKYYKLVEKQEK